MSSNTDTATLDLTLFPGWTAQVTWAALDAFNATMIPQVSNDGTNWANIGGVESCLSLDTDADTGGWEYEANFHWRYLRFSYAAGNVSSGTITIEIHAKRTD